MMETKVPVRPSSRQTRSSSFLLSRHPVHDVCLAIFSSPCTTSACPRFGSITTRRSAFRSRSALSSRMARRFTIVLSSSAPSRTSRVQLGLGRLAISSSWWLSISIVSSTLPVRPMSHRPAILRRLNPCRWRNWPVSAASNQQPTPSSPRRGWGRNVSPCRFGAILQLDGSDWQRGRGPDTSLSYCGKFEQMGYIREQSCSGKSLWTHKRLLVELLVANSRLVFPRLFGP